MTEQRTTSSTGGQKGTKLARFDLIPPGPLRELAEHYGRGAKKYADNQWRKGYEWSKSIAAIGRHFNDFMAGKDYDVCSNDPNGCSHVDADGNPFESGELDTCFNHTGSHHMVAVAWHSFLLLEFKDTHPGHDDRHIPASLEGKRPTLGIENETRRWVQPHFTVHEDGEIEDHTQLLLSPERSPNVQFYGIELQDLRPILDESNMTIRQLVDQARRQEDLELARQALQRSFNRSSDIPTEDLGGL